MTAAVLPSLSLPTPAPAHAEGRSLHSDNRGAVMMVGLFMGCSLVGSLWSMIGIGNAIVMREAAQQAADTGVFSSSVMQARGMNGIAAINMFMIALVALYLIMRMVALVLQTIGKILMATVYLAAIGSALMNAGNGLENIAKGYLNGVKPVLKGLSAVQTASAVVSGYLGQAAGIINAVKSTAKAAKNQDGPPVAITISPSMIPGSSSMSGFNIGSAGDLGSFASSIGSFGGGGGGFGGFGGGSSNKEKLGLPVTQEKMKALCTKSVDMLFDTAESQVKKGGSLVGRVIGWVLGAIRTVFSQGITAMFCNDSFWDENGPKSEYSKMENGNDWLQTHAIVPSAKSDAANSKASFGQFIKYGAKTKSPGRFFYTAQAESYFDCDGGWEDGQCNGQESDNNGMGGSVSSSKWRVRMVRTRGTSIAGVANFVQSLLSGNASAMFNGLLGDMLGKIPGVGDAMAAFNVGQSLAESAQSIANDPGAAAEGAIGNIGQQLFDNLFSGNGSMQIDLNGVLNGAGIQLPAGTGGIYH